MCSLNAFKLCICSKGKGKNNRLIVITTITIPVVVIIIIIIGVPAAAGLEAVRAGVPALLRPRWSCTSVAGHAAADGSRHAQFRGN